MVTASVKATRPSLPDWLVTRLLGLWHQETMLILALRQVYLEDGQPFEYVNSQYVGDRFEFYLENN